MTDRKFSDSQPGHCHTLSFPPEEATGSATGPAGSVTANADSVVKPEHQNSNLNSLMVAVAVVKPNSNLNSTWRHLRF